jgi:broad specificity phosphatase PhoE
MLLVGLGKKDTSLKATKIQAKKAAMRLERLSKEYDDVLLVGHGGMNWLIGNAVLKKGWTMDGKAEHSNWGTTVFKDRK